MTDVVGVPHPSLQSHCFLHFAHETTPRTSERRIRIDATHGLEPREDRHRTRKSAAEGTAPHRNMTAPGHPSGHPILRPGSCWDRDDSTPSHGGTPCLRRRSRNPRHLARSRQGRHGYPLGSGTNRRYGGHRQHVRNLRKSRAASQRHSVTASQRRSSRPLTHVDPYATKLTLRPRSLDREGT